MQPDAVMTHDLLLCAMLTGSQRRGTVAGLSCLWLIRDEEDTLPSIKCFFKTGAISYEFFKQGDQLLQTVPGPKVKSLCFCAF